jgi:hypothetical protein
VSYLGQSVDNCPMGIIFRLGPRQSHDEIHSNLIPLPLRYLQRLQQSSGSLLLVLGSLIGVAKGNILGNISLHSIQSICCLQIMVHLTPSRMNGISGLVSLSKYSILQLLDIMHTNPWYHNSPWSPFVILNDFSSLILCFIS